MTYSYLRAVKVVCVSRKPDVLLQADVTTTVKSTVSDRSEWRQRSYARDEDLMPVVRHLLELIRCLMADRTRLALENVALRHQVAVLKRPVKRPQLRDSDRAFWA